MLKIKYIREFEDDEPMLVITGEKEDYLRASEFLIDKEYAYFDDPKITTYYETPFITKEALYLTREECADLSKMFKDFGTEVYGACHDYFQTNALMKAFGEDMEVHISYKEYPDRIFDEWN